jgi:hypothetical protein
VDVRRLGAIFLVTFFSVEARAERWVNMDMEDWVTDCSINAIYRPSNPGPDSALMEFQDNEDDYQCPWITTSTSYGGAKSLGTWLKPTPDSTRSEIVVANPNDAYALRHGEVRYLGFAMRINNTSSDWPLPTLIVFHQSWMANTANPSACGIPLVGHLMAGTGPGGTEPLKFRFSAKWDGGQEEIVSPREMTIGPWHRFVIRLAPNTTSMAGTGNVTIYYDGSVIANWNHDWGCNPVPGETEKFRVNVGQYRPHGGDNIVIVYDNIRYASTYAEAAP